MKKRSRADLAAAFLSIATQIDQTSEQIPDMSAFVRSQLAKHKVLPSLVEANPVEKEMLDQIYCTFEVAVQTMRHGSPPAAMLVVFEAAAAANDRVYTYFENMQRML